MEPYTNHFKIGTALAVIVGLSVASTSNYTMPAETFFDSHIPILLGVIITSLGFIRNDVLHDDYLRREGEDVHTKWNLIDRWWMWLVAFMFPTGGFTGFLVMLIFVMSFYWVVFSLWLNTKIGYIFYISSRRREKALRRIPLKWFPSIHSYYNKYTIWGFKFLVLILSVVLYFSTVKDVPKWGPEF